MGLYLDLIWASKFHFMLDGWSWWLVCSWSSLLYFRKRGEPAEGRSLMSTTVLVDSGTYAIVRHPQFLGIVLLMCASILISQHWLTAIVGVPLIVQMSMWVQEAEEHLVLKFGDDYKRYMQRVPRMNLLLGIIRLLRRKWEKVNH